MTPRHIAKAADKAVSAHAMPILAAASLSLALTACAGAYPRFTRGASSTATFADIDRICRHNAALARDEAALAAAKSKTPPVRPTLPAS